RFWTLPADFPRSSLPPYWGVLSFLSEAREVLGSETAHVTAPARVAMTMQSPLLPAADMRPHWLWAAKCHVWTAPSWQGFSSRLQAGRCSNVFGLLARHTRPLAIMPCADQVPVKTPHSRCAGTSGLS